MLMFDEQRLKAIQLRVLADRLFGLVHNKQVRPPRPLTFENIQRAVLSQSEQAAQHGFASGPDYALYIIAAYCFPTEFRSGAIHQLIYDPSIPIEQKREKLNAAMAKAGYMDSGQLEATL